MLSEKTKRRLTMGIASAVLLSCSLLAFGYSYYNGQGPLSEPKTLLFKRGTGFIAIVDQMEEQGVIRNGWMFKTIAVLQGDARKFKSGEYKFSAFISPRLIMSMIAEGQVVVHRITVPEGLTVSQIKTMLDAEKMLEGEITGNLEEGSLLPQTYHYTYGDTRQDMINRMRTGMEETLAQLWEKRQQGLPLESPMHAVILASIVEKETGVPDERGRVASVFINRLRKGMKLQTDPTVIYAIEKDKGAPLGRPLMGSDLSYASPYNTYKNLGLPPGPIANPGRDALEATLNPPETDYLYFVATGTGGHNFSRTYAGHNENVREYRKALKAKK